MSDGIVRLYVDVKVDMDEMKGWRPETISRFFAGIAMVEAAREQGRVQTQAGRQRCAHGKTDQEACGACGTRFVWP